LFQELEANPFDKDFKLVTNDKAQPKSPELEGKSECGEDLEGEQGFNHLGGARCKAMAKGRVYLASHSIIR
jgi:hypothetical protein